MLSAGLNEECLLAEQHRAFVMTIDMYICIFCSGLSVLPRSLMHDLSAA